MNTPSQADVVEFWPDEATGTVWSHEPSQSKFTLSSLRGKTIAEQWDSTDAAQLVGCAISVDQADGATDAKPAVFPSSFRYSPNTGKALPRSIARTDAWLPPAGSHNLRSGLVRGGKLTDISLRLAESGTSDNREPVSRLPLPVAGDVRFLVGTHGLEQPVLIAMEWKNGDIYCWLPGKATWAMFKAAPDADYLGAESVPGELWQVECADIAGQTTLYWPCDKGLALVKLDPLVLAYEARILIQGVCVSQPLIVNDAVHVLMRVAGRPGISMAELKLGGDGQPVWKLDNIPEGGWRAAATQHEAVWISEAGQVVASPRRQCYEFLAWQPEGIRPQFMLGPPHAARDGRLWLQVLHPSAHDGEEGPAYLLLGRGTVEMKLSNGARTLSGKSSIKVEARMVDDPWIEPVVVSSAGHDNNEGVVPILESVKDASLLVLRVNHADGIINLFENQELISTRFQIMGQHSDDTGFYMARVREPWKTLAFVFNRVLFLSHPDLKFLPGWPLADPAAPNQNLS